MPSNRTLSIDDDEDDNHEFVVLRGDEDELVDPCYSYEHSIFLFIVFALAVTGALVYGVLLIRR